MMVTDVQDKLRELAQQLDVTLDDGEIALLANQLMRTMRRESLGVDAFRKLDECAAIVSKTASGPSVVRQAVGMFVQAITANVELPNVDAGPEPAASPKRRR